MIAAHNVRPPVRVAVIGAGAMAREHIKAFRDIAGVAISGIWNRTRENAQALANEFAIPVVADSLETLHAQSAAQLAVVAVYEPAIKDVMTRALRYPWAVLMEKPIGLNFGEAEEIAAETEKQKSRVFVGLNRRFLSSTQAVLSDLNDDPAPRFIHVQDQQSLEAARSIGHAETVVRNWMYANSIHLIDYFLVFGRGAILDVQPVSRWNAGKPGVVLAKITFESGDTGLYEGLWNGPGPWACAVTTPRRRWEMRPLEKALFQNAGERALNAIEVSAWDAAFKPGFRLQAEKVTKAIDGHGAATTLDEAMRTMRLVRDIFAA